MNQESSYQMQAARSKKGLQVEDVADALDLGVRHASLNFNLCAFIRPGGGEGCEVWHNQDRLFSFDRKYLALLDEEIKQMSDHGILVYLVVLTYVSGDPEINEIMLHPGSVRNPPNHIAATNTATEEGRAWFIASLEFMSARWSRPDEVNGRVYGYIIGNEVTVHWWWYNMGRLAMEDFVEDYLRTVRHAHYAVRRQADWPRVYISLDHHWNIAYPQADELQAFPGRAFVDYFGAASRRCGDFEWHVAFHSYPENLYDPRFWNDRSATDDETSPRITFKNLAVLTRYLLRSDLLFHGRRRSIILSEQGFHTLDDRQGEVIQAAAFCLAYRIVERTEGIDAFILHRHVDLPQHEGGLRLGLRSEAPERRPKLIHACFRLAGTEQQESCFSKTLAEAGLEGVDH